MLNLSVCLTETAARWPKKDAFVLGDTRLSYAHIDAAANRIANVLRSLGIQPGDRVALTAPNIPDFPIVYFGILRAGAVVTPLNVLLKRREIAYHLRDSGARAYFCFEGTPELPMAQEGFAAFEEVAGCEYFVPMMGNLTAPTPFPGCETLSQRMAAQQPYFATTPTNNNDVAVLLYTSGTTGNAKGAELTHANIFMNALACAEMLQYSSDDVGLVTLPLFHSFGQTLQLVAGVFRGLTSILLPRFDPERVLSLLQKERVTVWAGVPTMYWALLNYPQAEKFDLKTIAGRLRVCISGGSSLPVKVLEDFEKRFHAPICEGYGLSECSPVVSFNQLHRARKPGSIGIPVWGVEMRLIGLGGEEIGVGDEGEIAIRGPNVMKGYHGKPKESAEAIRDGWLYTGDVARVDAEGYYYIVDRTKDIIIRGGFNVYPREIEELLMTHEAVSLVAVIGVPSEQHGEEVKAFVVKKPGATVSEEALIAWCKDNLAAYKYPRMVEFRDALPMTATGKILKKELRGVGTKPGKSRL